ncbi:LOW QUALITY PROTEIN: APC membrane recruitment protein 2 [Artibeus jamaicensis]|uniref:LOW QUALITY PROTEIN: APC membrane recruitment protein 2 n=1 Tax=Artibeus jamaicensis TaxID=9417 RepID=UPI00235B137B|nr:LOW QUALITY PROTEIN: APC membrane recruitment protein 2 [Artibeus jamaicensis]
MTEAWSEPIADESRLARLVSMETSGAQSCSAGLSVRAATAAVSRGVCRRLKEAGARTLAADMDLPCDCAAGTPAADQPSGKINKAAFKLFKKRKSGSNIPSIFGVRNKGDGKGLGPPGMVRSRTHDGLAEVVVLENGRKEEPRSRGDGAGAGGDRSGGQENPGPPRAAGSGVGLPASSSVAKSHSFFSLLKKNGRSENSKGDPADVGKAGGKQKRGLRGLFSSVRWHRKDKRCKEGEREVRAGGPGGLALPGSLTASLECVREAAPQPACAQENLSKDTPPDSAGERGAGEPGLASTDRAEVPHCRKAESPGVPDATTAQGEDAVGHQHAEDPRAHRELGVGEVQTAEDASRTGDVLIKTIPPDDSDCGSVLASAVPDPSSVDPPSDPSADRICLMFSDVTSLKSFDSLTGCGDIIADQEEEAGPSCDKHAPGPGKPAASKKNDSVVAYQGGGEEMASPDDMDDTYLQEFWDMLSQTEDKGQGPQEGPVKAAATLDAKVVPETSKDTRCAEVAKDVSLVKCRRLNRIPIESHLKEEPKHLQKEQHEGVPNSDEGYWDSTTPGPEDDSTSSGKKACIPRDSYSGDVLYDLYADPGRSPAVPPANEETSYVSRLKPVSPVTITCPLRTPGSLPKDSKIPISVKHLANLPSSLPVVHQQPARSEVPRTKIPVSKVLVRRVSNRGLAGTTIRAAACHHSAKKL